MLNKNKLFESKKPKRRAAFSAVLLLCALLNCVALQAETAGGNEVLSKKEKLKALQKETGLKGKKLRNHLSLLSESPPYQDEEVQAYVTKIGKKILAQSEHADRPYKFIVRDTEEVNAFVNGTNYVFVERGLLALLNSEAELASVMAHEIGHNVARHTAKLQSSNRRNIFLANVASILAGNTGVGSAIQTQNRVNLLEYKREAELEADSFAARYLYGAKYEPSQLVNALAQLRDNNIFAAKTLDRNLPHHGLLTSHPRSDIRLRKAIADAGIFPPGEAYIGREEYREVINGLTYGPNYARNAPAGLRRHTSERLGITFLYPKNWIKTVKGAKIILKDPEQSVQFKITIAKTPEGSKDKTSLQDLKAKYPTLVNPEKIDPKSQRDLGTLGAVVAKRVALAKVARNTFYFEGIAKDNNITTKRDAYFVNMIRSFRRMTPKDRTAEFVTKIYFERLKPGETFGSLAKGTDLDQVKAEIELRVINGYYPKGEPEPGTWIKKLRKEKIPD
jgi:predicted Zn-dependent protease